MQLVSQWHCKRHLHEKLHSVTASFEVNAIKLSANFVHFTNQAIDSLQSLMSNSVSIRRGALESLLERANEKYAQRDLEDETAQPVWAFFYYTSVLSE